MKQRGKKSILRMLENCNAYRGRLKQFGITDQTRRENRKNDLHRNRAGKLKIWVRASPGKTHAH